MSPQARRKLLSDVQTKLSLLGVVPNRRTLRLLRSINHDLARLREDAEREALDCRSIPLPSRTADDGRYSFDDGPHLIESHFGEMML